MNTESKMLIVTLRLSFFILIFISFFLFSPAQAQTPTPYDKLIQAIQERAQQDVKLGKPAESIEGLNILFGESQRLPAFQCQRY